MTLEDTYPLSKSHKKRVRAYLSVATEACTQKMRKGLEYLQVEKSRIKDNRVRMRDQKSQFPFRSG